MNPKSAAAAAAAIPAYMDIQPRLGPQSSFTFPAARSFRLKNGLRVVLVPKADLPLVRLRLAMPCGTSSDPHGLAGVSYLTARLLDRGAGKRSALQLSGAQQDLGATISAWADQDNTQLLVSTLRRNLGKSLDLFADMLLRPRLSKAELARLKKEVRARVQQRRAQPAQTGHLALKAAVFGWHPYGRALLPLPDQLGILKSEHLRAFHDSCYRPRGAVLVASGDLSAPELRALLEQRLAGWSGQAPSPKAPAIPPGNPPRLVLIDRPGATQSVIKVGHLCPPRTSKQYAAMELLNTALGGSFTSRLNQNLREKNGFTYGVRSQFLVRRERGLFACSTAVATKDTVPALVEMLHELKGISTRPLTRAELTKARRLLVEEQPGRAETVGGLVAAYADLASHGLPLTRLNSLPKELAGFTSAQLAITARRLIRPGALTIVVVGDLAAIRPALEEAHGKAQLRNTDGKIIK